MLNDCHNLVCSLIIVKFYNLKSLLAKFLPFAVRFLTFLRVFLQFGEVDIDGSLVASHSSSNEDIVVVNNGCLCCTVRGDLVKMLLELVKKKRDKFDHIVIETTGKLMPRVAEKLQGLNFIDTE